MGTDRMPRRTLLKTGAAAAAGIALGALGVGCSDAARAPRKRPNIVFVFSDEHRWCSLPYTEAPHVIAPNLARLAQEGMRFDNCCSTSPICSPYRAMLLTGQWPHQSGYVSNDWIGDGAVIGTGASIARTFAGAGYATGYVGKWHLIEDTAGQAGFDSFQQWLYGDEHWESDVRDANATKAWTREKGYNAVTMTDRALDFIGRHAGGDKPFLLMLSLNPPHWRWDDAPEEFLKLYPQATLPIRPNVTEEKYKTGQELLYLQHYHAHITAVDAQLGRIMAALRERGIEDDTVLIYTSDHGSSFGSNGVGSKANPFDESVRVPFTVRWPGRVPAGGISDANLGTMDIYPTLCGLAGIAPPAHCGGADFSPTMLGGTGPDPATQFLVVNNFQRNYWRTQLDPGGPNIFHPFRGVRSKTHTFVVGAQGDWLLYDNRSDPCQQRNLVDDPSHAGVKEELRRELATWLAKAEDPFIPAAWRSLPMPQRIAEQNRYWSLLPFAKEHAGLIDAALAPWAAGATSIQTEALRSAAAGIYDQAWFGRRKAFSVELVAKKRQSKRPLDEIRAQLTEHDAQAAARLADEARRILGRS